MSVAEYEIYRRIKLLGEGAFGKAFLVESLKDSSLCVIKQVDLNNMPENEKRETIKEAKILEALKHPNIVRFREVYKTRKGKLCIVMDYADGGDLTKHINTARGSSISENQILDWFTQICLAMKHVHDRKILHRDLKCQNIFLTKTGIIKLGDFGIARVLSSTKENARTMVGTPYYLSPEIIDNKPYSFKSDIWSLGVVLYELCALKPPFDADSLPKLAMKIVRGNYNPIPSHYSKELKTLVAATLALDPNKRPSVHQMLKMPIITNRIKSFLSESIRVQEFSHTILHRQVIDPRMRFDEIKHVMNESPMPPSELRLQLLQEKKQKEYQDRLEKDRQDKIEREKQERERIEKNRIERERSDREKIERGRKERERLEQELREKENKLLARNKLKLLENDQERSPLFKNNKYGNKPYLGHAPYTPGADILSRNKPEINNYPYTPNIDKNRNNNMFNLFQRNDIKRNEVKPVHYAAQVKDIITEVNVRRDISPLKNYIAKKIDAKNNERDSRSTDNTDASSAPTNLEMNKPVQSEKTPTTNNNDNILNDLQLKVEETRSDKSERVYKASQSPKNVAVTKTRHESSSFKEKDEERKRRALQKEAKDSQKKREQVKELSEKKESSKGAESNKGKVMEIRNKLAEERKKMRDDIISKKKSFKKSDQIDFEVYMPTPSLDDDDEADQAFDSNDEEEERIVDFKPNTKEDPKEKEEMLEKTIIMEEENLIDMISEMQQIVDEASIKESENEQSEEQAIRLSDILCENGDETEDNDTYDYKQNDVSPLKEISNILPQNSNYTLSSKERDVSLKGFLDEAFGKEESAKVLDSSKQLLSNLLQDINLPVDDYSSQLRDQLCSQNPGTNNLSPLSYVVLFQALADL